MADAVELALPFAGTWLVQNSPARRVPSHGTHLFATTYAIDFVAVRGRRTADVRDWRTVLGTEPPERFLGFGLPVLAPGAGTVVAAHDGEPDHEARRSPLALLGYALTQASRARAGGAALAGNHVVLALDVPGVFVVLAHLRRGSVEVRLGQRVTTGDVVGRCGNSGNSTQPHVHVQAMDGPDAHVARGVPLAFRTYREHGRDAGVRGVALGVPGEGTVVEPA
ncbi:M23 family metallopeptidase [Cellulosimicrobium sp. 22601]|uniref:M23 family metallopeptidase n=1 Tax=unclassified Cellulosimicrobium TaxID=2624466 RepID=UPI003F827838